MINENLQSDNFYGLDNVEIEWIRENLAVIDVDELEEYEIELLNYYA